MSAETGIEWCDSTLNFWAGCTKVSPACDYCYAERQAGRFGIANWGAGQPRKQMVEATRAQAEKWNKLPFHECADCGWRGSKLEPTGSVVDGVPAACCAHCGSVNVVAARRRVFVNSWSDWLDNEVPAEWLVDLLDRIRRCPNIDFLLLTKRIGNWRGRMLAAMKWIEDHQRPSNKALHDWILEWFVGNPPANVWVGDTVVNQPELDRDLLKLYRVPAVVRFLSVEPMLSALNFDAFPIFGECGERLLHWAITGAESGPNARPSHPDWFRLFRDQAAAAGVAHLHKQNGEWHEVNPDSPTRQIDADSEEAAELYNPKTDCLIAFDGAVYTPDSLPDDVAGRLMRRIGKKAAGRLLDGVEHSAFPAVLP